MVLLVQRSGGIVRIQLAKPRRFECESSMRHGRRALAQTRRLESPEEQEAADGEEQP